jgi:serine/threonine-protein kinase RsbW
MVALVPSRQSGCNWAFMSFASTLYLMPVLDLLLESVPAAWKAELRLGLQEALVNAAVHGNQLDPGKQVRVKYAVEETECWWIITDQGDGFLPPRSLESAAAEDWICDEQECGRGLFILSQIFDQVDWSTCGTELRLCKKIRKAGRLPLLR